VVSRFHYIGTHLGDFAGVSATGGQVSVKGVVINRVIKGLLADGRILEDRLALMRQLGVVPSSRS
jgi:predicted ester cyclase